LSEEFSTTNYMKKVFIGNIPFTASEPDLTAWFAANGAQPASVAIVRHKINGTSRGFGFADFHSPEDAARAVDQLNGVEFQGRTLMLSIARSEGPAVQAPAPPEPEAAS
jgi:RNA recognition motif-containing protein